MRITASLFGVLTLTFAPWLGARTEAVSLGAPFVDQVYLDLLQRPADVTGHAFFASALDHASIGPEAIAQAVLGSLEYQGRLVDAYYQTLLHRVADPTGHTGFAAALMAGGRDEGVVAAIVGSGEYFLARGGGSDHGFLDALYTDVLHRSLDETGRTGFLQVLASGGSRAAVAEMVMNSVEAREAFVRRCYQSLLHRDVDPVGLQGFTAALLSGASNEAIVASIVGSPEYLSGVGAGSAGRPASFGACAPIDVGSTGVFAGAGAGSLDADGSSFIVPDSPLFASLGPTADVRPLAVASPSAILLIAMSITGLTVRAWSRRRRIGSGS